MFWVGNLGKYMEKNIHDYILTKINFSHKTK